ncbi:MAG: DUF2752 domain-containing protein [Opitutales bacterium]|nr:DUF2752 domain-containing protein [Opitutales bacterium]
MSKQIWVIVWGVFSLGCTLLVLAFFCLPEDLLHTISRSVSVPHDDCILCGMTRAFCAISRGDFDEAHGFNSGSLCLFFGMAIVSVSFFLFVSIRVLVQHTKI